MNQSNAPTHVVTCILESGGKILILKRSDRVGSYRGRWAGVAGYLETDPETQAFTEIREETGLQPPDVELIRSKPPITVNDPTLGKQWVIHPFLFRVNAPEKIRIDWEHTALQWIEPREIDKFSTVPGLKNVIASVYDLEE